MHGHNVCSCKQFINGFNLMSITKGKLVFNIIENNVKTEGFGDDTYLSTDMTVADDTDGLAAGFIAALCILVPAAAM